MYTELNEWANCPISLSEEEIKEPFLVIDDFFSADDLPGHLEHLKKWRARVIGNGYYIDMAGSPGGLLMNYELTVKLMEVAWVLRKSALRESSFQINIDDALTNQQEIPIVKTLLNESELLDPSSVLFGFFREHSVGWYRHQLQEWLTFALSNKSANEFIESPDLIHVFENLQKLYAAALVLFSVHEERISDTNQEQANESLNVRLYSLNTETVPMHREMFPNLVSVIKTKLPTTYAIYYLGRRPDKHDSAFLLVLTGDQEQGEALGLGTMLEESCRPHSLTVLVHYASVVLNAVNMGDHFFSRALSCPALYISGDLLLPDSKLFGPGLNFEVSEAHWERWLRQGKEFLSGAEYYLSTGAYSAALFSLHQSAECILIAIVRAVLGYRINSHNLLRLLRVTQFFTNDLAAVFKLETEEGKKNFTVLKEAYVSVRYRDNYLPDTSSVETLYPVVSNLLLTAEQVYRQFLLMNTI
jgi:HEPN domain-containing protein